MTRTTALRGPYVHALDGIRFFAVFMVLLKHVGLGASSSFAPLRVLGTLAKIGTGVPLFFVVSGFLITQILFETGAAPHRYRNFMIRRSLRIFPLYFGYLAAALAITLVEHGRSIRLGWVYLFYLQNSLPHVASLAVSSLPLYHLWTLGVQEQFYLLWPIAIWGCRDVRHVKRLCWTVIVSSLVARLSILHFADLTLAEQIMPCRAGEMAFGGLFAMEAYERTWVSRIAPRLLSVFAVLCVAMILLHVDQHPLGTVALHETIALFATSLLAAALSPASLVSKVLGYSWLAGIGKKYSYGLFIFHPMMIVAANHLLHLRPNHAVDGVVRVAVTVVSSVLLAKVSYSLFERHFLGLKRWFPAERVLASMKTAAPVEESGDGQHCRPSLLPEDAS